MKVKTYRAPTMKKALEEIKKDLGPDAFILSGKEIKPKKVLGVFGKHFFEVTAAVDRPLGGDSPDKPADLEIEKAKDHVQLSDTAVKKGNTRPINMPAVELNSVISDRISSPDVKVMLDEIRALKGLIQSIPSVAGRARLVPFVRPKEFAHAVYREVYHDLLSLGFNEELVHELLNQVLGKGKSKDVPTKLALKRKIATALSRRIKVTHNLIRERPHGRPQVIALIGPTGVGKTTTLAKLAARAVLEHQLDVALVTLDTYRIAAIEQLKTYAEIIGVPAHVVESVSQMSAAIETFGKKDLILIDTAGRSPRELGSQLEVAQYFGQSPLIHKSLVLSATTKEADLNEITKKYLVFGRDSLIVTKLDETEIYGPVISEVVRTGSPLAYITVGQNVPKDILHPSPARIVSLALGVGNSRWESFIGDSLEVRAHGAPIQSRNVGLSVGAR